jgi:mannosylglycerate hydrolase
MPWGYHNVTNLGYGIHWGDTSEMVFNMNLAQEKIERALQKLIPMSNTRVLLLMNGIDHAEAEPRIPHIIELANKHLGDVQITQGTLADHLASVRTAAGELNKTLPEFCGEFRWGRYSEILQGVYSTRIHLKQNNHKGEVLLERYAEPLTALAWLSGADVPEGVPDLLKVAWHWLLLNHPHDDIYGSGIDEVHHEMAHRFSQSRQIVDVLVRDSLRALGRQADCTSQAGVPLIAFNPLGWERREIAEALVDFEFDDPLADDFQVVDAEGRILAHQVVEDRQEFWMEVLKPNRKRRVKLLLPTETPGCGYTMLYVQPRSDTPEASALDVTERGAENSYHRFIIEADGGLTVTDKASGRTVSGLNHFFDVEDAGDEYTSCPFEHDSQLISTVGREATVTQLEAGPLRATFRVEHTLDLPAGLTDDRRQRSEQTIRHTVVSDISLYAGQPGIFITTRLNNQARDHKLSVYFPTGIRAAAAHVDESFMIATRELGLPDSTGWVEDPTPLMHQRAFTDLSDRAGGLAVLNRGLPSVEVHPDGTIALTLLRCVGWLSRDDLWVRRVAGGPLVPTPGAQCPGEYTFEYAILPHAGDWQAGEVHRHAYNYNVPTLIRRADTHAGLELHEMNITRDDPAKVTKAEWPRRGPLPSALSVVSVEPPALVLSAVYRSGEHLIVRCYNVTDVPVQGKVRFGLPVRAVERVNMNEEPLGAISVGDGNAVMLDMKGGEVITIRVK